MTKIRNLEKKYMDLIWGWVSSDEFSKDLLEIEDYIKTHYLELSQKYQIKNKLQKAAERLLNFYVHKKLNVVDIYPSPLSSDLAFFTNDCLINIDAKTIDLAGNEGDDKYIQFGPHQISFKNEPFFNNEINKQKFNGITLSPGLPAVEPKKNLPGLTFFLGITYRDDGSSFEISHIKLSCVPNSLVAEEDFKNQLITNFKTYSYLKKDAAVKLGKIYDPKPKGFSIPSTWIPFSLKNDGRIDSWFDTKLKHPFNKTEPAIWRILADQHHICLEAGTARIDPGILKKRKDDDGNEWEGVRTLKIKRK